MGDPNRASAIGSGHMGDRRQYLGRNRRVAPIAAIQASIDTTADFDRHGAPEGGNGLAEELVGKAIKGRRDRVVIATKCGLNWHHGKGGFFFEQQGKNTIAILAETASSTKSTRASAAWAPKPSTSTSPTGKTRRRRSRRRWAHCWICPKQAGKIRAIGISNARRLPTWRRISVGQGRCDTGESILCSTGVSSRPCLLCSANGVIHAELPSLAPGFANRDRQPERKFKEGDLRRDNSAFFRREPHACRCLAAAIEPIAHAHGATTTQLVIA